MENMPCLAHSFGKASDRIGRNGTHGQHVTCAHVLMSVPPSSNHTHAVSFLSAHHLSAFEQMSICSHHRPGGSCSVGACPSLVLAVHAMRVSIMLEALCENLPLLRTRDFTSIAGNLRQQDRVSLWEENSSRAQGVDGIVRVL